MLYCFKCSAGLIQWISLKYFSKNISRKHNQLINVISFKKRSGRFYVVGNITEAQLYPDYCFLNTTFETIIALLLALSSLLWSHRLQLSWNFVFYSENIFFILVQRKFSCTFVHFIPDNDSVRSLPFTEDCSNLFQEPRVQDQGIVIWDGSWFEMGNIWVSAIVSTKNFLIFQIRRTQNC